MDSDLFEFDDDDEIFRTVNLELEQTLHEPTSDITVLEFECSGDDSLTAQFSSEGFVKNAFTEMVHSSGNKTSEHISISSYDFRAVQLQNRSVAQFVFGEACKHIQYLMASIRGNVSFPEELSYYQHRRRVTLLYHLLLHTTHQEQWPLMRTHVANLRRLINRVTEPGTLKLLYFANSRKGNECNVPSHHLLHGVLEWKLLDLSILHKYDLSCTADSPAYERNTANNAFISHLKGMFDDLLICSIYVFVKKRITDLQYSSPFPCTCIKELWLLLQQIIQKWALLSSVITEENLNFWSLFNSAMEKIKAKLSTFSLNLVGFCEFANWLLHSLVRLHGYRSNGEYDGPNCARATAAAAENYEFYENCTKQFLNADPSEEQLRIYLCVLTPTLLQWWRPKVNIPQLLWEHLHKQLNSSCYIPGAAPSSLAVACGSGKEYLEKYRNLLRRQQVDANMNSYTLFSLLTGKILNRLMNANLNRETQKLLGRIYAKFSLQKLLTLNDMGIHHLIELFLILALCGDFNDLAPKLRNLLLSIGLEKVTSSKKISVTKGHMAMLILHAEQKVDFSDYVTKLLQQLKSVRNDPEVSKILADGLLDIFEHADDFQRGEHILIGAWLPYFLSNCSPVEQERSLEALHLIFVKLQAKEHFLEASTELYKSLNTFILPFVRQQYVSNCSEWLPQLAADFCTHSCAASNSQTFQKLLSYFIETQTANYQAPPQLLNRILETDKCSLVSPSTVMHVWLKSLVLLTSVNRSVVNLTKHIVQLEDFKFMTNLSADDILQAKEPLCVFVAAVGKTYDSCSNYQHRCNIADKFNAYLGNFEKWLHSDIQYERTELTFRFYTFLAIVVYNCPQIVYAKSKITCFFHVAVTRFMLPTSIQMGKPPEGKLAQLIHKVWPVLVQGIGRLNFKSDPYINKTLNDLIQKWTPHFKISTNSKVVARPFIVCLQGDNQELSLFIYERLTSVFLATQRRQADANACLVITIFQEVLEAITVNSTETVAELQLDTFMKGTCLQFLEHIMMVDELVPSRKLLLDLFKRLVGSEIFRNSTSLKELLAEHLRIITKKYLAYYTFFYFELLMKFTQVSYETVELMMDFLLAEVEVVEKKRGASEDNRIRGCLQKLRQSIESTKKIK